MPYRIASRLTFTDLYNRSTDEEQLAEQVAALDLVAQNGGTIEAQYVLWGEGVVLSIVNYPDQQSAIRAELHILQRRAFELHSQPALTVEEVVQLQAEAKAATTVKL
jgi:uncharacterized protein with GYD domain